MSIMVKLDAKPQPNAEMLMKRRPVNSNDLCLNRTHKTPMSKAKTTATMEERVRICPVKPTEYPNVSPMSIRRSPVIIVGAIVEKAEMTREGSINLPEEIPSCVIIELSLRF